MREHELAAAIADVGGGLAVALLAVLARLEQRHQGGERAFIDGFCIPAALSLRRAGL
ncbi:MAG TPA: hypothetical protein VKU41_01810 [Polyangiaceae bacterium]|nr:hypothetical protein [Polyangiaceae bacterium]